MEGNLVLSRKEGESVVLYMEGRKLGTVQCKYRDVLTFNLIEDVRVVRLELKPRPGSDGDAMSE